MSNHPTKPTVVLVHGAFAESASWNGVIGPLLADGHRVVAVANPLRGVRTDADYLAALLRQIDGDIVLVGHSYGGMVNTTAATGNEQVRALVYIGAFAPDLGESAGDLANRFEGSTLGDTLQPIALPDGTTDLYIRQDAYHGQFAADSSAQDAAAMAATQRPILDTALSESSGEPAWKTIPSWFMFGSADRNIPVAAHRFMAQRADARRTIEMPGGSHTVAIPEAATAVDLIREAATLPVAT